jgi:hypothetical protein
LPGRLTRRGKGGGNNQTNGGGPSTPRLGAAPRRRTRPYLVLGAVLAIGGAFAFAAAFSHLGGRVAVLQLAHAVKAGQVVTAGDLRSVQVAADSNVPLIPLSQSAQVVGHPMALTLPAGTLLSRADLGSAELPAGQTMVAVSVKAGAYPSELAPGAKVAVATAAAAGQGGAGGTPVVVAGLPTATVLSTTAAPDSSGAVSVSLRTGEDAAGRIASVPAGQVQLIVLSPSGPGTAGGN